MYAVMTRNNDDTWRLESRHRLFERAQESARTFTDAKKTRRRCRILRHRQDVVIMWERARGGTLVLMGPQSFEY